MALVKQSSHLSSMLLEVMWGLDIQSLSILGGDLDQTLFTFCFESVTSVSELSREGVSTSEADSSETVRSTDLWFVPMAPALKILLL